MKQGCTVRSGSGPLSVSPCRPGPLVHPSPRPLVPLVQRMPMPTPQLPFDTLLAARDAIRAQAVSSVELTRQALDRIERIDPRSQAFNSTSPDRALEQAKAVDDGRRTGPLAGVPVAIKDNLCTTFGTTTCSSQDAGELPLALRRHGRAKARGGRRGHRRQDQPRRVRHGQLDREQRVRRHAQPVGHRPRPRRLQRRQRRGAGGGDVLRRRSAPTPAARSASPPRCAASSGSSRPTAASAATGSSPSPARSTRSARSAGPSPTPRCC